MDSKWATYLQVNPELKTPLLKDKIFETERVHITRIRTGSHNLLIETGRFTNPKIPRELRVCLCGNDVQTLRHVLMECVIIPSMHESDMLDSLSDFFKWDHIHDYLLAISKTLKIEL